MWLTVASGEKSGTVIQLTDGLVIGRDESAGLLLSDPRVSRRHAYLRVEPGGTATLQDLGSTNGTFVNGERITGTVGLSGSEQVRVGDTVMVLSAEAPAPPDPRIGTVFGRYRIERPLADEVTGTVYLAEDAGSGRTVVLTVIAGRVFQDEASRHRFLRTCHAVAALDHPNIVPILDANETNGELYVATPQLPGETLAQVLGREGALVPEVAVAIAEQAARALDAAHGKGLVHGSVAPGTILVGAAPVGRAYLRNFGVPARPPGDGTATASGQGDEVHYLAPEQIRGEPVDGRADVYALGCALFEALTARVPFERDSFEAVMWGHGHVPPPRATDLRPELPPGIDAVLATAMAKSKEQRHATCAELVAAARAALALEPSAASAPVTAPIARGPATAPILPVPVQPVTASPAHALPPPPPAPALPPLHAPRPPGRSTGAWIAIGVALTVIIAVLVAATVIRLRDSARATVSPPVGLRVTAVTDRSIVLAWDAPPGTVTGYRIFRDGSPRGFANAGTRTFTDSSVSPGTTYRYTVVTVGPGGRVSSFALEVSATTLPAPSPSPSGPGPPPGPSPAPGALLLEDNFSDPGSGWAKFDDGIGKGRYVDGAYQLDVQDTSNGLYYSVRTDGRLRQADVGVEVKGRRVSGGPAAYGAVCRWQDNSHFYFLGLTTDGQARIEKFDGTRGNDVLDEEAAQASVNPDAGSNQVRADCIGDGSNVRLTVFVNGRLAAQAVDHAYTLGAGYAGMGAVPEGQDPVAVRFDDFRLLSVFG